MAMMDRDSYKSIGKKFISLSVIFLASALASSMLMNGTEKQSIQVLQDYDSIRTFLVIAGRNSVVFLLLFSTVYTDRRVARMIGILFPITNGVIIGALVARFPSAEYLIIVLPHGVLEMGAYFLLIGTISVYQPSATQSLRSLVKPICALYVSMLCAAWVEAYVTPYLAMDWLL